MRGSGPPAKPAVRRPLRTWFRSVYILLVFGAFLGAPENEAEGDGPPHPHLRALVGIVGGVMLWASTWILPVTFMIAMAWGRESHARQLGRRAQAFYGGEARLASIAIPIGFVAYADSVRQTTASIGSGPLGALVAVLIVIAVAVLAARRDQT